MADVYVRFDGSDVDTAHLARLALQPVLDAVYRTYVGKPQPAIEEVLRRAGQGSFVRENIDSFATHIAAGDRPVLTGDTEEPSEIESLA
ncbi:hypothetical protein ACMTN4_00845 (plasmid) [Rhodococcus globerulus]|uniref:hypothetical protein n=1 Tax=Rhodococcus globerulus TaxID=33008 RepID=UPI0039EA43CB